MLTLQENVSGHLYLPNLFHQEDNNYCSTVKDCRYGGFENRAISTQSL